MQARLAPVARLYRWGQARLDPLLPLLRSRRGRVALRVVGYGLMAAALLFIALILINSWQQIQPHLATMDVRLLLWAQLCTLIAYGLGAGLWLAVLRAFGIGVSWQWGVMTHLIANATKYIPGYGWQYVSKGYLLREQGKRPREITGILLTEVVLLLSSGMVAALLAGALAGDRWAYHWRLPPWLWWGGMLLVCLLTWVWGGVAIGQSGGHKSAVVQSGQWNLLFSRAQLYLGLGWLLSFAGWLSFAAATLIFINALLPITGAATIFADFLQALFALVASGLISILVIIVPGGFGVRETTLAALLIGLVALEVAAIVSILMRFSVMVCELLALTTLPHLRKYRFTPVRRG